MWKFTLSRHWFGIWTPEYLGVYTVGVYNVGVYRVEIYISEVHLSSHGFGIWTPSVWESTDKTKLSLIGRLGVGIFLNCGLAIRTYMNRCILHSIPHDILLHTVLHTLMLEALILKSALSRSRNFGRLNSWKNPLAKVVDFEPLGTLPGPGAPDPNLLHFQIKA